MGLIIIQCSLEIIWSSVFYNVLLWKVYGASNYGMFFGKNIQIVIIQCFVRDYLILLKGTSW
jgi:hypothetical protein